MARTKSKKSQLKDKAEHLMYELAFKLYGSKCENCNGSWRLVVHHFIPRRLCKALTYELFNWIILCANCHFAHHTKSNPQIHIKILEKRGKKWLKKLNKLYEKAKKLTSYYGVDWLEKQINKMQELNERISKKGNFQIN